MPILNFRAELSTITDYSSCMHIFSRHRVAFKPISEFLCSIFVSFLFCVYFPGCLLYGSCSRICPCLSPVQNPKSRMFSFARSLFWCPVCYKVRTITDLMGKPICINNDVVNTEGNISCSWLLTKRLELCFCII